MTVVVTGATGHVGGNLVRALLGQQRPVRALVHVNRQAIDGLGVEIASGDVRDPASLLAAFEGAEVVFHLAADISIMSTDWPRLEAINVLGTRNVVEACLKRGVRRLVHFSSIHAIKQEPLATPVDESRPPAKARGCPPYDRSKAAGEAEVRRGMEHGLDAVIISPTAIIGPYDYQPSHLGAALLGIACGKLPALVNGGFDWVDVRDVVSGAIRAEQVAPAGAKYLLSGHWLSMPELAGLVAEVTGVEPPGFACPLWLASAAAPFATAVSRLTRTRPLYTSASMRALHSNRNISHERATRELGYQPRPLSQTIADTIRWFRENGRIPSSNKAAKGQ